MTIDPGLDFRLIAELEKIHSSDEYYSRLGREDGPGWYPTALAGHLFESSVFVPHRRRVRKQSEGWRFLDGDEKPKLGDDFLTWVEAEWHPIPEEALSRIFPGPRSESDHGNRPVMKVVRRRWPEVSEVGSPPFDRPQLKRLGEISQSQLDHIPGRTIESYSRPEVLVDDPSGDDVCRELTNEELRLFHRSQ